MYFKALGRLSNLSLFHHVLQMRLYFLPKLTSIVFLRKSKQTFSLLALNLCSAVLVAGSWWSPCVNVESVSIFLACFLNNAYFWSIYYLYNVTVLSELFNKEKLGYLEFAKEITVSTASVFNNQLFCCSHCLSVMKGMGFQSTINFYGWINKSNTYLFLPFNWSIFMVLMIEIMMKMVHNLCTHDFGFVP